jgi:hypothetical protein
MMALAEAEEAVRSGGSTLPANTAERATSGDAYRGRSRSATSVSRAEATPSGK